LRALKYFSYLLWFILFLILFAVGALFFALNNQKTIDFALQNSLNKFFPDLKYEKLSGDIFSGIGIKGFNYKDKVKGDIYLKADFSALKDGELKIEDVNLTSLWIDEKFLKELLNAPSKKKQSSEEKPAEIPIKKIDIKNINLSLRDFTWDQYRVDNLFINVKNLKYDMKEKLSCVFSIKEDGNVASLHLLGRVDLPKYRFSMDGVVKKSFVNPFIEKNEVLLKDDVKLFLKGEGDFDDLITSLNVKPFNMSVKDIDILSKKIATDLKFGLKSHDADVKLYSFANSNIADLDLKADAKLNIDDINNTLNLNSFAKVVSKKLYLKDLLKDSNITLLSAPTLDISLSGEMKKFVLKSNIDNLALKTKGIDIKSKRFLLSGNMNALAGDFDADVDSFIFSKLADLSLRGKALGNINDINNTLKFDLKSILKAQKNRIKNKDIDIIVLRDSFLKFNAAGDLKEIKGDIKSFARAKIDGKKANLDIKRSNFYYSLLSNRLKSDAKIDIDSYFAKLNGDLKVDVDIDDLNNSLNHRLNLKITKVMPIKDLNLAPLLPLKVVSKGGLKSLKASLHSPKLKLFVKSDLNRFDYRLKSKDINISKIYTPFLKEGKNMGVRLNSSGFYIVSKKTANIKGEIENFILDKERFHTKPFLFRMKGEDLFLDNLKVIGKDFWVSLKGSKRGENVKASLFSPGISLPEGKGKIKDITLKAQGFVNKDGGEIKIKKAGFSLIDFKPKEMNRVVSLKRDERDGIIQWKGEDAKIDLDFGEILKFSALKKGDVMKEKIKIEKLYLGYEDFGHTTLSADVKINGKGPKNRVKGDIYFFDTLITYKPKFLSISEDPDIVIVTKESKKKKPKKENKNFIKNFAIDLNVKSKDEMLYKTDDAEIAFKPDLKIVKEFNEPIKLLGKIKILEGFYDFADKRYLIEEGAIAFRGGKQINPLLDIHIKYDEIEDVVIYIDIRGDAKRPKLSFRSNPMMPKKDILSYLSFGMSTRELKNIGNNAAGAAEKIFSKAVSKDLAKALNLDRLYLSRNKEGGFNVKAGKKLNKKTIDYYLLSKQKNAKQIYL